MKKTVRTRTHYKATFVDSSGVPRLKVICARGLGQAHTLLHRFALQAKLGSVRCLSMVPMSTCRKWVNEDGSVVDPCKH